MKTVTRFSLPFLLVTGLVALALLLGTRFTAAEPGAPAVAPAVMNYQGYLTEENGDPYEGLANLKFGVFAASSGGSAIWDEDHTGVSVSGGYFSVLLGSTDPLSAVDFSNANRYLEVIVNTGSGDVTLPRQRLGAVPYALQAQVASVAPWSGLTGVPAGFADGVDDIEFENVIVVAKSGGHFTTIQAAIDSIGTTDEDNRYLVWVAPGTYDEQVVMKDFVYIVGASQWLTIISSDVTNGDIYPPDQATLHLSSFSEVRNLTVINEGTGNKNVAILGDGGSSLVKLAQVTARTHGSGEINYGIFFHGPDTHKELYDVHAMAANSPDINVGFENVFGAATIVEGGSFSADGGNASVAIVNANGAYLRASGVNAQAHNANWATVGLQHELRDALETVTELDGGQFVATTAFTETLGILVIGGNLQANNIYALGEGGDTWNQGLHNNGGTVHLNGGIFTGRGGLETYGIINLAGGWLEATGITSTGEGGAERNDGLRNEGGAGVLVAGGLLRGRHGADNRGVANYNAESILDLNQVTLQGEGGPEEAIRMGGTNEDGGQAFISNSELWGDSASFLAEGVTSRIYLSRLIGGPVDGSGEKVCLGVTHNDIFYADLCPVVLP